MLKIAQLAGFFAAHGVWCVSDGETLTPLMGLENADGAREMIRFPADDIADAARAGQDALQTNRRGARRAVLVVDGYIHLDSGSTDALIVDAVEYEPSHRLLKMVVPYRSASAAQGFAVHRPRFLEVVGIDEQDRVALPDAFFAGVGSHEKAASVWHGNLEDSI